MVVFFLMAALAFARVDGVFFAPMEQVVDRTSLCQPDWFVTTPIHAFMLMLQ
jgi:hypothetical protein